MIRYKKVGSDKWFEDDHNIFLFSCTRAFHKRKKCSMPLYMYNCSGYNITNINLNGSELYDLMCFNNYIKSLNVNNQTCELESDNIQIIGNSENMEIKFIC